MGVTGDDAGSPRRNTRHCPSKASRQPGGTPV